MAGHSIAFSTPPADVSIVHDFIDGVWKSDSSLSEDDRMAVELALVELTSNVLKHADDGTGVSCRLELSVDDDAINCVLSDTGEPGDIVLSHREMPDDFAESGRGLALVQLMVDDLDYRPGEPRNVWTFRRPRTPAAG